MSSQVTPSRAKARYYHAVDEPTVPPVGVAAQVAAAVRRLEQSGRLSVPWTTIRSRCASANRRAARAAAALEDAE